MRSIRTHLVLFLIVPLSIVAFLVSLETFFASRKISNELHDETLLAVMLTISENVVAAPGDVLAENILEVITNNLGDQFFYHVAGPNNAFVTGYAGRPPLPTGLELKGGEPVFYDATYQGDPVRVAAIRLLITIQDLNGWTTITTWQRISQRQRLTFSLFGRSLGRLFLILLSAGVIVWFAVASGLKPIGELRNAIDKRTSFDLNPIRRPMPVELHGIVEAMNDLLSRVARSKANRERFIGDAAHQLRNPIAALKTQAQTTLQYDNEADIRNGLDRVLETTNQTERLIEHMLASAGVNALEAESFEAIELNDLVEDAARANAPSALQKTQDFSLDVGGSDIIVRGHRILLREAVSNLIDNAIKHSPDGARIWVGVSKTEDQNHVRIGIADSGGVMDEETWLHLSQPFSTGGTHSSGSGLGLSIAKDVAKAHGGELTVAAKPEWNGKEIAITLPMAD